MEEQQCLTNQTLLNGKYPAVLKFGDYRYLLRVLFTEATDLQKQETISVSQIVLNAGRFYL